MKSRFLLIGLVSLFSISLLGHLLRVIWGTGDNGSLSAMEVELGFSGLEAWDFMSGIGGVLGGRM